VVKPAAPNPPVLEIRVVETPTPLQEPRVATPDQAVHTRTKGGDYLDDC